MLSKKTVLVVGAGAGVDFGMPIGMDLMNSIARDTDFLTRADLDAGCAALYRAAADVSDASSTRDVLRAGRLISDGVGFTNSIDDFLFTHGEDEAVVKLGKMAIAGAILKAERSSKIEGLAQAADFQKKALSQVDKCWLHQLINLLAPGVRKSKPEDLFSNLTIINFNYDRCVELYLHAIVQRLFGIPSAEAAELVATLNIYHPYGTLGPLPWQAAGTASVPFGVNVEYADLRQISERIKTFTEQHQDDDERQRWREVVRDCRTLVFLGFAFHPQNVELIRSAARSVEHGHQVLAYASAFDAQPAIRSLFERRMNEVAHTSNAVVSAVQGDCRTFMQSYGPAVFS